jgi:hypothetical protein
VIDLGFGLQQLFSNPWIDFGSNSGRRLSGAACRVGASLQTSRAASSHLQIDPGWEVSTATKL